MMAGYEVGNPLQRTLEVTRGEHAYFFDRWWQQRAILLYFKTVLPSAGSDSGVTTAPTSRLSAWASVAPMSRRARFECVEDDADELSFEAADGFAAAFAFGAFAFE